MLFLGFISRIQILIILLFCLSCGTVTQNNSQTCENDGMINFTYINIPCKNCIYLIQDLLDSNQAIFNYDITENNIHNQISKLENNLF